ncbi:MAG: cytochrome b/b6 domain-containing protein [Leucobacter sp.]
MPGGEAWPPETPMPAVAAADAVAAAAPDATPVGTVLSDAAAASATPAVSVLPGAAAAAATPVGATLTDSAPPDAAPATAAATATASPLAAATLVGAALAGAALADAVGPGAPGARPLRRGLPRVAGGDPWPPGGEAPAPAAAVAVEANAAVPAIDATGTGSATAAGAEPARSMVAEAEATAASSGTSGVPGASGTSSASETSDAPPKAAALSGPTAPARVAETVAETPLRRGLPRTTGGDPWPPAGFAPRVVEPRVSELQVAEPQFADPAASTAPAYPVPADQTTAGAAPADQPRADPVHADPVHADPDRAGSAPDPVPVSAPGSSPDPGSTPAPKPAAPPVAAAPTITAAPAVAAVSPVTAASPVTTAPAVAAAPPPAPTRTAEPPTPASAPTVKPAREARGARSSRLPARLRSAILGLVGIVVVAGVIVLAARGVTTLPGVPDFLQRYPGEYHPRVETEDGFPAWARWTHYLNFFFLVLIVRSGLLVRRQQKPDAFYTPKRGGKKVSIYLWLHTGVDVLWLVNGAVFVVLLFATGHWARIVPTSWEVFPNAASAALQYLTLEWPVEDAWVNYNSLQQLMYFTVVFVAAPLAAITGVRMSEWWPERAGRLNRVYPAPVARAIHYPTMLFFVLFVIVHVFLVFTTGALKNLGYMFDGTPEASWAGFWWFAAGLAVAVGAVLAARPIVLAPIASLTGKVTSR